MRKLFSQEGCCPHVLLRDARKYHHWTQKELGEKIGVSVLMVGQGTLSHWCKQFTEQGEQASTGPTDALREGEPYLL